MTKSALLVIALVGCWKSKGSEPPTVSVADISVELSAVTLGDDCPDKVAAVEAEAGASVDADCDGNCGGMYGGCEQTSMQLSVKTGAQPTTIHVKRVELLDSKGNLIGVLPSRAPTLWTSAGAYEKWDESIGPDQKLAVSYALGAPNWNRIDGGRWAAQGRRFQVRVTLAVGTVERTFEKRVSVAAMIEPMIET